MCTVRSFVVSDRKLKVRHLQAFASELGDRISTWREFQLRRPRSIFVSMRHRVGRRRLRTRQDVRYRSNAHPSKGKTFRVGIQIHNLETEIELPDRRQVTLTNDTKREIQTTEVLAYKSARMRRLRPGATWKERPSCYGNGILKA